MSKIDQILNEQFGYTVNVGDNTFPTPAQLHEDPTTRNGKGGAGPAQHPLEKYRQAIRLMLGHLTTEEQSIVEGAVDWIALKRLAHKHGLKSTFTDAVDALKIEFDKKDKANIDEIKKLFKGIQKEMPYWMLGMIATSGIPRQDAPDLKRYKLTDEEEAQLVQLKDIMDTIEKVGKKEGERAAKETPTGEKTQAEKNLEKATK